MTTHQVVTFMSDGVAARVESPSFMEATRRLVTELGMTTHQVVTFMSGGVAARVESPSFMEATRRLVTELGMTTHQVVTFMSDGVAVRVESPDFFMCLTREWKSGHHTSLNSLRSYLCHTVQRKRARA
jgi:hypothetical protein